VKKPNPGAECEGLPPVQLYDLDADIGERRNVQDEHPEVVEELKALLTRYVADGRSIPGEKQSNVGGIEWPQLWWMLSRTAGSATRWDATVPGAFADPAHRRLDL